jgi:hypothetical protein
MTEKYNSRISAVPSRVPDRPCHLLQKYLTKAVIYIAEAGINYLKVLQIIFGEVP